jgi:anti-anti-sigma regulatory factor
LRIQGRVGRRERESGGEREVEMNEHEKETRIRESTQRLPKVDRPRSRKGPGRADLVVDLSGIKALDVTNLALLLTAQQHAQKEDRAVWLTGVPVATWHTLHAMGLGRLFKPFPGSMGAAA